MNQDSLADRVTELEIQLTHSQHSFDQLNEVVIDQAKEIDQLKRHLAELKDQFEESKAKAEAPPRTLEDEKPPHY